MTIKNGYEYINGFVQHKLIYPVSVKTAKVYDGSMQKVVMFSNGVGVTERLLKSEPTGFTQEALNSSEKGISDIAPNVIN